MRNWNLAMSRSLGGQYQAIEARWTDYAIYKLPDASRIAAADRQPLMDAMNAIVAVNWNATEPHWTTASSPFAPGHSLILAYDSSGLIAFSVYRLLQIAGGPAIYRSGTEVLPAHQGRGLYGFFTSETLKCAGAVAQHGGSVLYGWRTRNPIVWATNARICERVTPSLLGDTQDPALQMACIEMCASLYPGKRLEVPDMIMRGAYGHIKHHRQDYHGTALLIDAAMSRIIPDPADALFSVGYAKIRSS